MPSDVHKEAIVRINVNRLNPFSYWFCLDRAGPEEKKNVWTTLNGADTFPSSFAAVDSAIRSSVKIREGRPARKSVLNTFVLSDTQDATAVVNSIGPTVGADDIYRGQGIAIRHFKAGWSSLLGGQRELRMLESEWNLKVIAISNEIVAALLAGDSRLRTVIDLAVAYHGAGTREETKAKHALDLARTESELLQAYAGKVNADFWSKGIVRNHDYESKLKGMYPLFNTGGGGFRTARPDLIVSPYVPCSILSSPDDEQSSLNQAIRRDGNVIEFTAIRDFTPEKLFAYLRDQKIANYVDAVQEQ